MLFFASYCNKIDKKGRVSVPAAFRTLLLSQEFTGMIAYASLKSQCIEACGLQRHQAMNARLQAMDPFSPERDALETMLFGESVQIAFDGEGRVMLPSHLLAHAGIQEEAMFVGKGDVFEIWEPGAYARHAEAARNAVKGGLLSRAGKGGAA